MPVELKKELIAPTEAEFKRVAYDVVGQAFDVHSDYGTLFSENVYQHELAERCRKAGLKGVETEVPITIGFQKFRKEYFIDLLVEDGALFELKCLAAIVDANRAQTLNYLFLSGLRRGKLINFGGASLEHEFVSTTLTPESRRQIRVDDRNWVERGSTCGEFRQLLEALLRDWGAWLTVPVYHEALVFLLGGKQQVVRDIAVSGSSPQPLLQRAHLSSECVAFKMTAIREVFES